ncbi:unnamed protein product [Trichobilharzia regenti]|nr:unnamed protein product [Trichobilharzia regenti]
MAYNEGNHGYFDQPLEPLNYDLNEFEASSMLDVKDNLEPENHRALINAAMNGNLELVNHLFSQYDDAFDFQNLDEDGNSLMHIGVKSKQLAIVRYLVEHNVPLYTINKVSVFVDNIKACSVNLSESRCKFDSICLLFTHLAKQDSGGLNQFGCLS